MARGFSYAPGASDEVTEAQAPGLTKERMLELGVSRNPVVREAIAARPECPFGLMVSLAHDHAPNVRAALATNPRALHSLLEHLARDRQSAVQCAVARNPLATAEMLDALAGSRKPEVRDAATAALERRDAGPGGDDRHMPELRDRVFEQSHARRAALLEARSAPVDTAPAEPPAPRPTRTAPVRGFRPPTED